MAIVMAATKLPKTEADTAVPKYLNRAIARLATVPLFNARSRFSREFQPDPYFFSVGRIGIWSNSIRLCTPAECPVTVS